jgi:hypothetical protein
MTRRHALALLLIVLTAATVTFGVLLFVTRAQVSTLIAARHASTQKQLNQNAKQTTHATHVANVAAHRTVIIYRYFTTHGVPLPGPEGKNGTPGPRGPAGIGLRGPQGAHGASGASTVGPAGPAGMAGADATAEQVLAAVGAYCSTGQACTGPQGAGPSTAQIEAAVTAYCLSNACIGATGPTGPTGPMGDTGPMGLMGLPGTNGTDGISPTVTQLSVGDSHCPLGGASITGANGNTAYVCSGA